MSGPAPAKINLSLDITGKRPDGYHDLRSVMQTLALADRVTIRMGTDSGISITGPRASGVPADETNLAWRAAVELATRVRRSVEGLHIAIEKNIPAAGGLGGGASDAATVLRLLQQAWSAPEHAVIAAANDIGSDEAFFLRSGTALVEGRGERVSPVPALAAHDVVLFPFETDMERKTAQMFAAVVTQPYDDGSNTETIVGKLPGPLRSEDLSNGFERVAFDVFPGLAAARQRIERAIEDEVRLCGAGPTLMWVGPVGEAAGILERLDGVETIVTTTTGSQWAV